MRDSPGRASVLPFIRDDADELERFVVRVRELVFGVRWNEGVVFFADFMLDPVDHQFPFTPDDMIDMLPVVAVFRGVAAGIDGKGPHSISMPALFLSDRDFLGDIFDPVHFNRFFFDLIMLNNRHFLLRWVCFSAKITKDTGKSEKFVPISRNNRLRLSPALVKFRAMRDETRKKNPPADPRIYALNLLARREYTVGQMRRKLKDRGVPPKIANTLVADLVKGKYIDDERFARMAVRALIARKPAGRNYLVSYLQKKLIARELAVEVVEEILEDQDETEMAVRLLRSRRRYFAKFEVETSRRKAYNYLSRRSIGYNAARKAFDMMMKEDHD